jgi:hypothetical protein
MIILQNEVYCGDIAENRRGSDALSSLDSPIQRTRAAGWSVLHKKMNPLLLHIHVCHEQSTRRATRVIRFPPRRGIRLSTINESREVKCRGFCAIAGISHINELSDTLVTDFSETLRHP